MRTAKCRDTDSIDFLIARPKAVTSTEAAAVQPDSRQPPAHDRFTRLLRRIEPDPEALGQEARPLVHRQGGVLVLDDSTLDKPSAEKIELVGRPWSGKPKAVVWGINRITMVWTDGGRKIPCDYRLDDKGRDGQTKNDHFRALLAVAQGRGFAPECVAFDGGYSGLEDLEAIRGLGRRWLTPLKENRNVKLDRQGLKPVSQTAIVAGGTVVHLAGYGLIRGFKIVSRDGAIESWATGDLARDELERLRLSPWCWALADYHRGLKQCGGVARAQVRAARAQRNPIGLAIRAFLRLEHHFFTTGVVGTRPKPGSSAARSGRTSPSLCTD